MKITCPVLLLFVLCGAGAEDMHRAAEGGNITVECVFDATGTFKRFCKNKCRNKHDILVEISGSQKQRKERGRYSMDFVEYVTATPYQAVLKTILDVSITHVRLSDSGWYSCALDAYTFWGGINPQVKAFWIVITEGAKKSSVKPTSTAPRASTFHQPTTQQIFTAPSEEEEEEQHTTQSQKTTTAYSGYTGPSRLLWLLFTPMFVLMTSVPLILICRKKRTRNDQEETCEEMKTHQNKESTYQSLHVDTMDLNQTYSSI